MYAVLRNSQESLVSGLQYTQVLLGVRMELENFQF